MYIEGEIVGVWVVVVVGILFLLFILVICVIEDFVIVVL